MNIVVPNYKNLEQINRGGSAIVYKALRQTDNLEVVLKVITDEANKDPEMLKGFINEAKLLLELNSSKTSEKIKANPTKIIRVYELLEKPRPITVMEYFPNSTNLKYRMVNDRELVKTHWHKIILQIGQALDYMHKAKIIHKDLKPENVLINNEAEVRLIDFTLSQKLSFFSSTVPRKIQGTPIYMAPEQIMKEKLDPRTDIYSFGVLIYELMCKTPPFTGQNQNQTLEKHLKERPMDMSHFNPNLPKDIIPIVQRMLEKLPDRRFPDVYTILLHLMKLKGGYLQTQVVGQNQNRPKPPPRRI
ncbi:MAG: serine/threonine-protein kinase [Planctomycetota bacterium]